MRKVGEEHGSYGVETEVDGQWGRPEAEVSGLYSASSALEELERAQVELDA